MVLGGGVGDPPDRHLRRLLERRSGAAADPDRGGAPQVLGQDLDVVATGTTRLDRLGHRQVEACTAQWGEAVDHHLPDQGVGEPEGARLLGMLHQQPFDQRRLDALEAVHVRGPGRAREQVQVDVTPDHAGRRQELLGVGRQAREPTADDVTDGGGHLVAGQGLLVEQPRQLDRVEGVALGPVVDP